MRLQFLLAIALIAGVATAYAQTAPSQPPDPTAQSPTTQAPATSPTTQAPATPPTFPDSTSAKPDQSGTEQPGMKSPDSRPGDETSADASQGKSRVFMGTIVEAGEGCVLQAGDIQYKLDDQEQAKKFRNKNVKVMGTLDKQSNTIQVKSITASSM